MLLQCDEGRIPGIRYRFSEFFFLRKFEISREKLRKFEKNQNDLRKFEKMDLFEKTAKLRSEMRVTDARCTRNWSRIFPRREHAVRTFSSTFYKCVSHGHHAIIHGTLFKTRRLTGGLRAARCKTQSPQNRHQTAQNAAQILRGFHV